MYSFLGFSNVIQVKLTIIKNVCNLHKLQFINIIKLRNIFVSDLIWVFLKTFFIMLAIYIRRHCDTGNVHQSQHRLCNLLEMFTFHRCVIYQSKHFLRNLISRSPQRFYLSIRTVMNRPGKKSTPSNMKIDLLITKRASLN